MKHPAVIVIGAGASGLACCERLQAHGIPFLLVEARSRIGGRVYSTIDQKWGIPIEFGAEFIHGAQPALMRWLDELRVPFCDVRDSHHVLRDQQLEEKNDYWDTLQSILQMLKNRPAPDRSLRDFLRAHPFLSPAKKSLFAAYVEGFHSADLEDFSEAGFALTEETDDPGLNGTDLFRPLQPYGQLLEGIFSRFANPQNFRLNTIVQKIDWQKNSVRLQCEDLEVGRPIEFHCQKLVVTLPVGVLGSTIVEWHPYPAELRGLLNGVAMGSVERMVFRFRERFWEDRSASPISFLHAGEEQFFPTWWTLQPIRSPHLVAWQGGPGAQELSRLLQAERLRIALASLAKLTGVAISDIEDQLECVYHHNWSQDFFSLGSYSYILQNGVNSWQPLRNIQNTLFFAGEAMANGSERGTVHGALNSGLAAAEAVQALIRDKTASIAAS